MRTGESVLGRNAVIAGRYLIASLCLAAVAAIYEKFSHGIYSYSMVYAFMIPLILGSATHLADRRGVFRTAGPLAELLLAASVTTLSVGSFIRGVLEIYGTTNQLTIMYAIFGIGLLTAMISVSAINLRLARSCGAKDQ